jgi:hypothetical protein
LNSILASDPRLGGPKSLILHSTDGTSYPNESLLAEVRIA